MRQLRLICGPPIKRIKAWLKSCASQKTSQIMKCRKLLMRKTWDLKWLNKSKLLMMINELKKMTPLICTKTKIVMTVNSIRLSTNNLVKMKSVKIVRRRRMISKAKHSIHLFKNMTRTKMDKSLFVSNRKIMAMKTIMDKRKARGNKLCTSAKIMSKASIKSWCNKCTSKKIKDWTRRTSWQF